MIILPGQRKYKLRRIDQPIIRKEDKYEFTVECPELREAVCLHCHAGQIEVAYSQKNGIFDVYRFPCKCSHVNGYEWWQLANTHRYADRPAAYQCLEGDIPGHVFIHPIYSGDRMSIVRRLIHKLAENAKKYEIDPDLEF